MHSYLRILLAAALLLLAAACGGTGASTTGTEGTAGAGGADGAAEFPLTVSNCDRVVTIEERPQRVLTIGTSAVNLLYAAGAADRIAARSGEFGTAIPGPAGEVVADVPVIVPEDPTAEVIIGAGVDIVIGYGLWETTPEDLEAAGIPTLVSTAVCGLNVASWGTFRGVSFDNVYSDIELYGDLFGTQEQAGETVAGLRERVAAVEADAAALPFDSAAAVYFTGDTLGVLANQHMMQAVIDTLGLANSFEDLDDQYVEASVEELITRDPDVVIVVHGYFGDETFEEAKAKFLALPGVADMTAVREDRFVGLFYAEAEPQPSAVDGLETVAETLVSFS